MKMNIRKSTLSDAQALLSLYKEVYGNDYPLAIGRKIEAVEQVLSHPDSLWLSAWDQDQIMGSCLFEVEQSYKIAKLTGLAVHPDYRGKGIASELVEQGTDRLISEESPLHSMYSITRTQSASPQNILLKNGFRSFGLFPNAHRLKEYETLTLMVRFKKSVLQKRVPVDVVPQPLVGIVELLEKQVGLPKRPQFSQIEHVTYKESIQFDFTYDEVAVKKKFLNAFQDSYDRFYPFHDPNFLMTAKKNKMEIYANLNQVDGYCAIISVTEPFYALRGRMSELLAGLRQQKVRYVEVLIGLHLHDSIAALVDTGFVATAVYPAMLEMNGKFHDMVLLSYFIKTPKINSLMIDPSLHDLAATLSGAWHQV